MPFTLSMRSLFLGMLKNGIISVDRLTKYSELEEEGPLTVPGEEEKWKPEGSLEFQDVSMRYEKGLPRVMTGVSFAIAAGESLGIIGRTGAGKSTVLACLFRTTP